MIDIDTFFSILKYIKRKKKREAINDIKSSFMKTIIKQPNRPPSKQQRLPAAAQNDSKGQMKLKGSTLMSLRRLRARQVQYLKKNNPKGILTLLDQNIMQIPKKKLLLKLTRKEQQ